MSVKVTRHFLGWDEPLLESASRWLLEQGAWQADLAGVTVYLPGRRAVRRLLDYLVLQAGEAGLALAPPRIVPIGALLADAAADPANPPASPLEQQLAWFAALNGLTPARRTVLLGERSGSLDFFAAHPLVTQLIELQRTVAAGLHRFRDVAELVGGQAWVHPAEVERWQVLASLQEAYLAQLCAAGRSDTTLHQLQAVLEGELLSERQLVIAGVIDANRLQLRTMELLAAAGASIDLLVAAPQELDRGFTPWGQADAAYWSAAPIDLPDEDHLSVAGPVDQARLVVQLLRQSGAESHAGATTLVLPEPALLPHLEAALALADLPCRIHTPQRHTLRQTALGRALGLLGGLAAADLEAASTGPAGLFGQLAALLRHPDLARAAEVEPDADPAADRTARHLDDAYAGHLGASADGRLLLSELRKLPAAELTAATERAVGAVAPLAADQPAMPLRDWVGPLQTVIGALYARPLDGQQADDRHLLRCIEGVRAGLKQLAELEPSLEPQADGPTAIRYLLALVGDDLFADEPTAREIDAVGFLEAYLDDAQFVVVTSFAQDIVPESFGADAFLPGRLRQELGLPTSESRYARDACITTTLVGSGYRRVLFTSAARDASGSPLLPSKLALATTDAAELARRFLAGAEPRSLAPVAPAGEAEPARSVAWIEPATEAQEVWKMSVTSFKTYLDNPWFYYLRYIARVGQVAEPWPELDPLQFGSLTHTVLEQFALGDLVHSSDEAAIVGELDGRLQAAALHRFGRRPGAILQMQLAQLGRRLHAFASWQAEQVTAGWRIEATELPLDPTQCQLALPEGRTMGLSGRIDRVDRHRDGRLRIIDYKTGESGKSPRQTHLAQGAWIDLQLPLYHYAWRQREPDAEIEVGYLNLDKSDGYSFVRGEGGPVSDERRSPWTDDDFDSAVEVAVAVATAVQRGLFPDQPRQQSVVSSYGELLALRRSGAADAASDPAADDREPGEQAP